MLEKTPNSLRQSSGGKNWLGPAAVIVLGGLFQAGIVLYFYWNLDPALSRLMPDDAFYYLKIAENIRHGLGSVFSIGEPTNGYHPLWMLLLVLIQVVLTPGKEEFILQVLLLALVLNLATATVLSRLLSAWGFSRQQCLLGTALYLSWPWFVNLTLTGMETPLFYLCLFLFFVSHHNLTTLPAPSLRMYIVYGITAGLVMLARTDGVFFPACGFILILLRSKTWRTVASLALAGGVTVIVLSPWLVWNLMTFGTIMQSSGVAMSVFVWYNMLPPWSIAFFREAIWAWAFGGLYRLFLTPFVYQSVFYPYLPWYVKLPSVVGLALTGLFLGYRRFISRNLIFPVVMWLPVLLSTTFYLVIRLFVQVWNLAPLLVLVLTVILNVTHGHVLRTKHLGMITCISILLTCYSLTTCYFYSQQADQFIRRARSYQNDSARTLKIGMTDAGYFGYFSRHTIVNLDGVVNNRALDYILAGRFSDYLRQEQFDEVVVDTSRLVFYDRNMGNSLR